MKRARLPSPPRRRRIGCLPLVGLTGLLVGGVAAFLLRPQPTPTTEPLPHRPTPPAVGSLRAATEFDTIVDADARSVALFVEAGRVIQSPRCLNCHPRGDSPTQTDAMRLHRPAVLRGPDGGGAPSLRCPTCHHAANFEPAGVPGNPKWRLAPAEMAWQGKTLGEICRQIRSPAQGGMTPEALLHHMAEDELVGWAWTPGGGRKPAPGSQAEFGALISGWLKTGGRCPE